MDDPRSPLERTDWLFASSLCYPQSSCLLVVTQDRAISRHVYMYIHIHISFIYICLTIRPPQTSSRCCVDLSNTTIRTAVSQQRAPTVRPRTLQVPWIQQGPGTRSALRPSKWKEVAAESQEAFLHQRPSRSLSGTISQEKANRIGQYTVQTASWPICRTT